MAAEAKLRSLSPNTLKSSTDEPETLFLKPCRPRGACYAEIFQKGALSTQEQRAEREHGPRRPAAWSWLLAPSQVVARPLGATPSSSTGEFLNSGEMAWGRYSYSLTASSE